jgi:hypothetical protein
MNSEINQWAIRHGVSLRALIELEAIFGIIPQPPSASSEPEPHTEAYVQSLVRLEAGRKGLKLWRNNVGVLPNPETGTPVRYGLGNDSPKLNKILKSGDLIGWRSILITPAHVGHKIAQFVSRECKKPDWIFTGTERETAQLKWAEAVVADGGDASFVTGEGSL